MLIQKHHINILVSVWSLIRCKFMVAFNNMVNAVAVKKRKINTYYVLGED